MAALAVVPPVMLATGVPITSQSMGPMLAGAILGSKRGALSQLLFLALVAVGLPLLVGGRGGMTVFAGPTAGFLFSWPIAAFVIGWLFERYWAKLNVPLAFALTLLPSLLLMYGIGNAWLSMVAPMSYLKATIGSLPFLPGDLVKALLTALIALNVKRSYPLIRPAHTIHD